MPTTTISKRFLGLLTVMLTATVCAVFHFSDSVAAKGKPGGGGGGGGEPPPPVLSGTVYFSKSWNFAPLTMTIDGSVEAHPLAWGHPSFQTHDGVRWFANTSYASGAHRDLEVSSEDGLDTVVLITDNMFDVDRPKWVNGDNFIHFTGTRSDISGIAIEHGIYFAEIGYGPTGEPIGLVAPPMLVVDLLSLGLTATYPGVSPDGMEVAINNQNFTLNIYSTITGQFLRSVAGSSYGTPEYSPDGSRIVYRATDGIRTVSVAGGPTTLVAQQTDGKQKSTNTRHPKWSPDSQMIVYSYSIDDRNGWIVDLYMANKDGSGKTNLTNGEFDDQFDPEPRAWR